MSAGEVANRTGGGAPPRLASGRGRIMAPGCSGFPTRFIDYSRWSSASISTTVGPVGVSRGYLNPTPSRKAPPMLHNPPIVITQRDFGLLRRLAGHPRLAAELKRAVVIDSRSIAPDIVTMNCRVRFEDQNTSERREVTIVFPHDANASTRSISVLTRVGTALLGLTVGQSIIWPFPDGTEHCLRVLKIISQPEADDASNERAPHAKHAACDERSA